jgi:hypothetical protein
MGCRGRVGRTRRDAVAPARVGRPKAEDVHCLSGRRDAEKGRRRVEGHAEDPGRYGPSPELVQLLRVWNGEDADYGALLRCCGQQSAVAVQRNARQRRIMCFYHIHCLHFGRIVNEDLSACRGDVIGLGWGM